MRSGKAEWLSFYREYSNVNTFIAGMLGDWTSGLLQRIPILQENCGTAHPDYNSEHSL